MSSNIRIERTCLYCGDLFIAKTTVTKYCSDNCAKRAYKKRKRQETLQTTDIELDTIKKKKYSNDYLSIEDTCKLLGISRWTISRMLKRKQIQSAKFGNRVIIKKSEIDKLFNR